jgi:hypothetical protein
MICSVFLPFFFGCASVVVYHSRASCYALSHGGMLQDLDPSILELCTARLRSCSQHTSLCVGPMEVLSGRLLALRSNTAHALSATRGGPSAFDNFASNLHSARIRSVENLAKELLIWRSWERKPRSRRHSKHTMPGG